MVGELRVIFREKVGWEEWGAGESGVAGAIWRANLPGNSRVLDVRTPVWQRLDIAAGHFEAVLRSDSGKRAFPAPLVCNQNRETGVIAFARASTLCAVRQQTE